MQKVFFLFFFITFKTSFSIENVHKHWDLHKQKHNLNFDSTEELHRFSVFKNNYHKIIEHNNKNLSYTLKLNQFAHITDEEYIKFLGKPYISENSSKYVISDKKYKVGDSGDFEFNKWVEEKYVSPVKDQKQCGSCWAFSAVGTVESHYAIRTKERVQFSEQQLVDCFKESYGCNGGFEEKAILYIATDGIMLSKDYPYTGMDGICKYQNYKASKFLSGMEQLAPFDEDLITYTIQNTGPVSIAIDADGDFRFYHKGVYNPLKCSSTMLNHAVIAVGYGRTNKTDYFIVRNSWSASWGDKGYIKMIRNAKNKCGVATIPAIPIF